MESGSGSGAPFIIDTPKRTKKIVPIAKVKPSIATPKPKQKEKPKPKHEEKEKVIFESQFRTGFFEKLRIRACPLVSS